jgi:hypothetical protein
MDDSLTKVTKGTVLVVRINNIKDHGNRPHGLYLFILALSYLPLPVLPPTLITIVVNGSMVRAPFLSV